MTYIPEHESAENFEEERELQGMKEQPTTVSESKQYSPDELNTIALKATQQMLNQSKHTPTPWTVTNSNNSDYLDIDGADARICSIHVNEVELNEQGVTREEAEANAQRIVTAVNNYPDLLEASILQADYIDYVTNKIDMNEMPFTMEQWKMEEKSIEVEGVFIISASIH